MPGRPSFSVARACSIGGYKGGAAIDAGSGGGAAQIWPDPVLRRAALDEPRCLRRLGGVPSRPGQVVPAGSGPEISAQLRQLAPVAPTVVQVRALEQAMPVRFWATHSGIGPQFRIRLPIVPDDTVLQIFPELTAELCQPVGRAAFLGTCHSVYRVDPSIATLHTVGDAGCSSALLSFRAGVSQVAAVWGFASQGLRCLAVARRAVATRRRSPPPAPGLGCVPGAWKGPGV